MLNQDSMNTLAQLAWRSVVETDTEQVSLSAKPIPSFDCKAWRSNGFSDSAIYRSNCDSVSVSIRSWPKRFDTPSKVAFWSGVNVAFSEDPGSLKRLGASNAIPFPRLYRWRPPAEPFGLLLRFEDQYWTLSDWVQGQPIAQRKVDRELVQHLAAVLGRLHAHSRDALGLDGLPLGLHPMQSNSIRERLESLNSLDYRMLSAIDDTTFFLNHNLSDRVKHCIAIVLERGIAWQRFLKICEGQTRTCHWIVRDLWRENVLLDDSQRFSSIVDLGATRFDWPGLDFTRLFGSLSYGPKKGLVVNANQNDDLWADAYAAYTHEHSNHAIESLDECRMLHLVSHGLAILQWVQWIKGGTFDFKNAGKTQRVSDRISELCDQFLTEQHLG